MAQNDDIQKASDNGSEEKNDYADCGFDHVIWQEYQTMETYLEDIFSPLYFSTQENQGNEKSRPAFAGRLFLNCRKVSYKNPW